MRILVQFLHPKITWIVVCQFRWDAKVLVERRVLDFLDRWLLKEVLCSSIFRVRYLEFALYVFAQWTGLATIYTIQLLLLNVYICLEINLVYSLLHLVDEGFKKVLTILIIELWSLLFQLPDIATGDSSQLLNGTVPCVYGVVEPGLWVQFDAMGRIIWRVLFLQDRCLVYVGLTLIKICTAFCLAQLRLAASLVHNRRLCVSEDYLLHTVVLVDAI